MLATRCLGVAGGLEIKGNRTTVKSYINKHYLSRLVALTLRLMLFSLIFIFSYDCKGLAESVVFRNAHVTPTWGETGTTFTFSLNYFGPPPENVRVVIDRQPFDMTPAGNTGDGLSIYKFVWTASGNARDISHYFEVKTGGQIVRDPPYNKGDYHSPKVIEKLSQKNSLYVFNVADGHLLWEHENGTTWIESLAASIDGRVIACRDSQGLIKVFSRRDPDPAWSMMTQSGKGAVAVDREGRNVIVTSGNTVYAINASGRLSWRYKVKNGEYSSLALSKDGKYFIAAGDTGSVDLFGTSRNKPLRSFKEKGAVAVTAAAISGNGQVVAITTSCFDRKAVLLSSKDLSPIRSYEVDKYSAAADLVISEDGQKTAVAIDGPAGIDSQLVVAHKAGLSEPIVSYKGRGPYRALAATDDMSIIAAGGAGGDVVCFGNTDKTPAWRKSFTGAVGAIAVSPKGDTVVSGSVDGVVRCFSADSGELLWDFQSANSVSSLAFSPDGNTLVVANGAEKYLGMGIHESFEPQSFTSSSAEKKDGSKDSNGLGLAGIGFVTALLSVIIGFAWFITKKFALPRE